MIQLTVFMLHSIGLAVLMTAAHVAVLGMPKLIEREPELVALTHENLDAIDGGMLMSDEDYDYRNAVLPDQEEAHAAWIAKARKQALELARRNGTVTSDDIWTSCPPPATADKRVMGAVFHPRKDWMHVGYTKSVRAINHGRAISVWRLAEAA